MSDLPPKEHEMSIGTIREVDPATLNIAANVRKDTKLSKEFVASIKQHGVKVPIRVAPAGDNFDVIDGQRRALAAVDAGVKLVPVYVTAAAANEAERIVDQLVMNDNREALTNAEAVAAVKDLELFGMSVPAIVKKTGYAKKTVEAAIAVAGSKVAAAVMVEHQLTLEQASVLLEFEGDEAAVKQLTETAAQNPHNFAFRAEQIRDGYKAAARLKELTAAAKKAGLHLVEKPTKNEYDYGRKSNKHYWLADLVDKATGVQLVADEHAAGCPGHAACISTRSHRGDVEIHLLCTDPSKYGHREKNSAPPKPPMTDEERAERRQSIENGKAWPIATAVRLEWLSNELFTRKQIPAGWEQVVGESLLELSGVGSQSWNWGQAAATLLGLDGGYRPGLGAVQKFYQSSPPARIHAMVAVAVAKVEDRLEAKAGWKDSTLPAYLQLLNGWGYSLSDLEQMIVDSAAKAAAAA